MNNKAKIRIADSQTAASTTSIPRSTWRKPSGGCPKTRPTDDEAAALTPSKFLRPESINDANAVAWLKAPGTVSFLSISRERSAR